MNVAVVVHNYDSREGTGGYVVNLLPRLAAVHDITLYAAGVYADVPEGVRVVRVPAVRSHGYATVLTFPAAFRAVRRPHDLVHAQGWLTGRADVVTAHIVLAAWQRAARAAGQRLGTGERLFGRWVAGREARLYRSGARAVIAPSRKVRDELQRHYDRAHAVHVVRHAFPAAPPAPERDRARAMLRIPREPFVALYAGDARKGLDVALGALAHAPSAHLVVVSHAPARPYVAAADRLGVGDRVHWAGPQADMNVAYGACDALLHPTLYDAFGLVVAEAMAAGVVPIVSRHAGIAEALEHHVTGWVLERRAPDASGAALEQLARDGQLHARLAAGARQAAAGRTWDDVARETLAVYATVAAEPK